MIKPALRGHEEGHVALAIRETRASYERLAAAGPFVDCRAARRVLLVELFRLRQRQAFVHERYDRVTRVGPRQWAWQNWLGGIARDIRLTAAL